MKLSELQLRSFRNYRELALDFDPGVNLIIGDNAQGKTNLLEAIAFLGSGRSFRAQKTREMVLFGEKFAEIAEKVEAEVRENLWKLTGAPKAPAKAAERPIAVSADDFSDED